MEINTAIQAVQTEERNVTLCVLWPQSVLSERPLHDLTQTPPVIYGLVLPCRATPTQRLKGVKGAESPELASLFQFSWKGKNCFLFLLVFEKYFVTSYPDFVIVCVYVCVWSFRGAIFLRVFFFFLNMYNFFSSFQVFWHLNSIFFSVRYCNILPRHFFLFVSVLWHLPSIFFSV